MKTILSIDFDIIMAPSIELYNSYVPQVNWTNLKNLPYLKNLQYDENIFNTLVNYIKRYDKNSIIFIKEHDEAVKYIKEPCVLYNIDHHHDCGYSGNGDTLSCANWIKYLHTNNLIENVTWYCDKNSNKQTPSWAIVKNIEDTNVSDIPLADIVIIANSAPWIPPEYQYLFEELKAYAT